MNRLRIASIALLVLAACGGGGGGATTTVAGGVTTTASTEYVLIEIDDLSFPAETVIPAGKSVAFQNHMLVLHQVVMETHDGAPVDDIDPVQLAGDAIHEIPLEPGTWTYFCSLHPEQMTGTLTVEG